MKLQSFQQSLRVLHIMSTYRWTGVAEPAVSLAKCLESLGHTCWVAGIWGRSFEEIAAAHGARLAKQLPVSLHYNPIQQAKLIKSLRHFCAEHDVDIVHTHLPHDHWIAALAFRSATFQRPVLVRTYHRYEEPRRDPLHRWLFEQATDGVITVSSAQRDILARAYRKANVRVILGGVNVQKFHFDPEGRKKVRADMGEKPDAMVAGLVAHLGYNRGIRWLLAAAPKVLEAVPHATIWIVGQGELKEFLRHELRNPKYRRRVLLAGYRTTDLPDTYSAIDVGLLLGLGSEGSARAALETMATGRPVVAVRKGALIDTITDGVDGFLVDENDVDGLARALIELLASPDRVRVMGEAARQKMINCFTEERRANLTAEFYYDLIKHHTSQR
ncbi:MAG: glycosyltransferase family 4 protein [Candidatus Sumerlaeaceae bacterium]|nr:glycosyltransferase family 4 protein [Candidatus Sumerlaeaceae bacterium]